MDVYTKRVNECKSKIESLREEMDKAELNYTHAIKEVLDELDKAKSDYCNSLHGYYKGKNDYFTYYYWIKYAVVDEIRGPVAVGIGLKDWDTGFKCTSDPELADVKLTSITEEEFDNALKKRIYDYRRNR